MKKFELTTNTRIKYGRTLIQIKATVSFDSIYGSVKKGDLGGWIESENSLQNDTWAYENAEVFKDAIIRGGVIWGGVIRGGVIRGGEIRGGVIRGGVIRGGEIWGGVIRGGEIRGGVIRGGEIWGGVIRKSDDYIAFCSIGSSGGVLTAYMVDKNIEVTRGCFRGTIKEFEAAVKARHKDNQFAKEYAMAVKLIKARFSVSLKVTKAKKK